MSDNTTPYADTMLDEVVEGLGRPQKELPPKYFYDERGAALFDRITTLPEYYLTRAERALLHRFAAPWLAELRAACLIELGAGSADKTQILLDALHEVRPTARYVPVDISSAYLNTIVERLANEMPGLDVEPVEADLTVALSLPADTPRPAAIVFLGSTIGNLEASDAIDLLRRVRHEMRPGDRFLLGADLRKDRRRLEAAYNDRQGVTAEFNLNMLRVLNRELGADFDLDAFEHRAFYDEDRRRIEMHLVARAAQTVHLPGAGPVRIAAGESIRTEISCKYDRRSIADMLTRAGMTLDRWVPDDNQDYALAIARLEADEAE